MLKGIIFSLITGLVGGLVLHFAEYAFFIPIFMHKSNFVPKKPPPLNSMPCKCTPGNIFHDRLADGNVGPKMVVIGAGCFRMGNLQTEKDNELPIHKVSVNSFAMSRYEISFAEYDRFAQKTHRALPDDNNWGRGQRPVINVSWYDANAYTEWLSQETQEVYRLPKESEWEYAARADTDTPFWWGNTIKPNMANCENCGSPWDNKQTAPVGSFAANPFKLFDTVGNVYEWTCSEYEEKYTENEKETRCLSQYNTNALRVIRGGSWYSGIKFVRVSNRYRFLPNHYDYNIGFRIVREVPQNNESWTKLD